MTPLANNIEVQTINHYLKWITRVPLSIKAAQLYVRDIPESQFTETDIEGYKAVENFSWIIFLSCLRAFQFKKNRSQIFYRSPILNNFIY